jgi:hypothetical protein
MGKVGRLEAVGKSSWHEFVVWTRWAQCQGAFVVEKSPGTILQERRLLTICSASATISGKFHKL